MSVVTDWSVYLDEPKKTAKKTVETIVQNPSRVSIFGARASGKRNPDRTSIFGAR